MKGQDTSGRRQDSKPSKGQYKQVQYKLGEEVISLFRTIGKIQNMRVKHRTIKKVQNRTGDESKGQTGQYRRAVTGDESKGLDRR